jgi:hypothetical protein
MIKMGKDKYNSTNKARMEIEKIEKEIKRPSPPSEQTGTNAPAGSAMSNVKRKGLLRMDSERLSTFKGQF